MHCLSTFSYDLVAGARYGVFGSALCYGTGHKNVPYAYIPNLSVMRLEISLRFIFASMISASVEMPRWRAC